MTDPVATADDVRREIDTVLDDEAIEGDADDPDDNGILGRVAREIGREYDDEDFEDEDHRRDMEATLAAFRIASGRDRRAESVQSGRSRVDYEVSEVQSLQASVRRLDPGDAFSIGGVRRTNARLVRSSQRDQ